MSEVDELYVMARRVLLDAFEALKAHRDAVVLVGAQAVYLRVGEADLAVSPFTTDGDIAIDPAVLAEDPPIEKALTAAGFSKDSVGTWIARRSTIRQVPINVAIDLLVPEAVSPTAGRRSARLPGHDAQVARNAKGLEGAIVDAEVLPLNSLDSSDTRSFDIRVAGPAALLVAKVHKIHDRQGTGRLSDKDALDVLRLLRGTETDDLAARYRKMMGDPRSAEAAQAGLGLLEAQFAASTGIGVEMAVRSAGSWRTLAKSLGHAWHCRATSSRP